MKRVYLDTETTDLNPGQIAELTMIIEDSETNKLLETANYFFEVSDMQEGAQKAHGFSIEALKELSGGVKFSDKFKEIAEKLSNSCIVAHNVAFDEKFISSELWRCGISFQPASRFCTMSYFKPVMQIPARYKRYGPYKNPRLEEVLDYLNISSEKASDYSKKLFNYEGSTFHDSRFDTTAMYVAVNVYREKLHGGDEWHKSFCK